MRERPLAITKVTPRLSGADYSAVYSGEILSFRPRAERREESAACRQRHHSRIEAEVYRGLSVIA